MLSIRWKYIFIGLLFFISCKFKIDSDSSSIARTNNEILATPNLSIKGDSLKKSGILLNKYWHFKMEDSMVYAQSSFIDTLWEMKSTSEKLITFRYDNGYKVGWFRKKINIDSAMLKKLYCLKFYISGAAEVFLNDNLLIKLGKIENELPQSNVLVSDAVLTYSFNFREVGQQTIAIRFLFTPQNQLTRKFEKYPFDIRLKEEQNEVTINYSRLKIGGFIFGMCSGFFFMMAIVHFFFFYLFRSQRFNIRFSLSMMLFGIFFYSLGSTLIFHSINASISTETLQEVLFTLGHILLLSAVYEYVNYTKRILFWSMTFIFLLVNLTTYLHWIPEYIEPLAYLLLIINYIYIIYHSIKSKHQHGAVLRNAIIIFISCIVLMSFSLALVVSFGNSIFSEDSSVFFDSILIPLYAIIFSIGPQLSVSLATTFSLAKEYVKTNSTLKKQYDDIERLSIEKQEILSNQNEKLESEVRERTAALEQSITELHNAQAQLIQSEKMASLGELTAGIAHEIKNPLNFVNNFSELNIELMDEMKEALSKNNLEEVHLIAENITLNLSKISSHGKRADSIVKSMLEHSRKSTGKKEMIDINALVKEYFNLAYHGTKAKNKSFNCGLEVLLDETLSDISIIPQDIGRVILNISINAFYAVDEAKELHQDNTYLPLVKICTKQCDDGIEITIEDNGKGIPDDIKDKIFQPFYTTKPTGKGTGLGLSLAYDIITSHGGTIKVLSTYGKGTSFVIYLPC